MRSVTSFLMGMLIGGAIGALMAILFAPASGEELRVQIQERAQQVQTDVRQAAAARRAELEERLASLRASGGTPSEG